MSSSYLSISSYGDMGVLIDLGPHEVETTELVGPDCSSMYRIMDDDSSPRVTDHWYDHHVPSCDEFDQLNIGIY